MRSLKLALIHTNVKYKAAVANREALLRQVDRSAREGARIILAPEMAISGYSFDNRDDVAPFVEAVDGPTLTAVKHLARTHGVYICIGLALEDEDSGIFRNSAVVVAPDGNRVCRYNKINAESRWACPGDPRCDNTFDTPWGRVGVLICSDTYNGLMPRVAALRGADLLLVPANWPPSGLDPLMLWRVRAMENGFYLAACNRTGVDRKMDCRPASSAVLDPRGSVIFEGKNADSQIFYIDLPLTADGRLDDGPRQMRLADRRRELYFDCYLNLRMIRNLTEFLELPPPGILHLSCVVPNGEEHPADALVRDLGATGARSGGLYLLPPFDFSDAALDRIAQLARQDKIGVVTCRPENSVEHGFAFHDPTGTRQWRLPPWPDYDNVMFPRVDFEVVRFFIAPFEALTHPELAVAASKRGCDLALSTEARILPEQRLLAGARTIENLAVAVCASNGAGIWTPPEGHHQWAQTTANTGESCRATLDTRRTRSVRFQDNIDFELLLRK